MDMAYREFPHNLTLDAVCKVGREAGNGTFAHYDNTWRTIRVILTLQTRENQKRLKTMALHL